MSVVEHPFDLVLFDLDGTLIDSVPQLALAVNQMLRECGFDEVPEAVVRTWSVMVPIRWCSAPWPMPEPVRRCLRPLVRPLVATIRPACWRGSRCMRGWPPPWHDWRRRGIVWLW